VSELIVECGWEYSCRFTCLRFKERSGSWIIVLVLVKLCHSSSSRLVFSQVKSIGLIQRGWGQRSVGLWRSLLCSLSVTYTLNLFGVNRLFTLLLVVRVTCTWVYQLYEWIMWQSSGCACDGEEFQTVLWVSSAIYAVTCACDREELIGLLLDVTEWFLFILFYLLYYMRALLCIMSVAPPKTPKQQKTVTKKRNISLFSWFDCVCVVALPMLDSCKNEWKVQGFVTWIDCL